MSKLRNIISLVIVLATFYQNGWGQENWSNTYYTGLATDAPGKYRKISLYTANRLPKTENSKALQMMDALMEVCKEVYPEPKGVEVGPYGGIQINYRGTSEFP